MEDFFSTDDHHLLIPESPGAPASHLAGSASPTSAIAQLNAVLEASVGIGDTITLDSCDEADADSVVRCVRALVDRHFASRAIVDDLRTQAQRMASENARLSQDVSRHKGKAAALDEDKASLENRMRATEQAARKARAKVERSLDDLQKRHTKLLHRDTQYNASMRKREIAFEKMKKQLSGNMNKMQPDRKRGMSTSKAASQSGGTWVLSLSDVQEGVCVVLCGVLCVVCVCQVFVDEGVDGRWRVRCGTWRGGFE